LEDARGTVTAIDMISCKDVADIVAITIESPPSAASYLQLALAQDYLDIADLTTVAILLHQSGIVQLNDSAMRQLYNTPRVNYNYIFEPNMDNVLTVIETVIICALTTMTDAGSFCLRQVEPIEVDSIIALDISLYGSALTPEHKEIMRTTLTRSGNINVVLVDNNEIIGFYQSDRACYYLNCCAAIVANITVLIARLWQHG